MPAVDKFAPARASPPRGTGRGLLSAFWGLTCTRVVCDGVGMSPPLTVQVVVRMSAEMRQALTAEADRQERTEAQIMRLALRDYLEAPELAA